MKIVLSILLIACLLLAFTGCGNPSYSKYDALSLSGMTDEQLTIAINDLTEDAYKSNAVPPTELNLLYAILYQNELIIRQNERMEKALTDK